MFTSTVVCIFYKISTYTGKPVSNSYQYNHFCFCTVILQVYVYMYTGEPYTLFFSTVPSLYHLTNCATCPSQICLALQRWKWLPDFPLALYPSRLSLQLGMSRPSAQALLQPFPISSLLWTSPWLSQLCLLVYSCSNEPRHTLIHFFLSHHLPTWLLPTFIYVQYLESQTLTHSCLPFAPPLSCTILRLLTVVAGLSQTLLCI